MTRRASFNPVTYTWDFDFTTKGRVKEVFKGYDNYKNPTKKLRIFDELFNRSLSENNYSSYEKNEYDNSGHSISFVERKWTLYYKNNEIDFSQQP
ncbi:hypothetical protein [Chryseobacterium tongliaoense]|uniref:hypothetical protein n=1 Tax=Chryseobacterium tongliaoense TaxID=3240933 RepID=UPI003516DAA6